MKKKSQTVFSQRPCFRVRRDPPQRSPPSWRGTPGRAVRARQRAVESEDTRGHTWTHVDVFGGDGSQLPAGRQLRLFSRNCLLLFLARSRCLE